MSDTIVRTIGCQICGLTKHGRHRRACVHYDAARELLWRLHNPDKAAEDAAEAEKEPT